MKLFSCLSASSRFGAARLAVLLGLSLLGASHAARAETINIDFNFGMSPTYVGVGAAPDTGTVWNGFTVSGTTQTRSGLLNSTGVATTVSVTQNLNSAFNFLGVQASGNSAANLLRDGIRAASPRDVTLNNLTAGSYDLYLYGVGSSTGNNALFTVGGLTQTTTGPIASTVTPNLTLGEDYVVFSNVMATSGSINIIYAPTAGSQGHFNGFQVQNSQVAAVPEPSTYAMMIIGLGAIAFVGWKRRESQSEA